MVKVSMVYIYAGGTTVFVIVSTTDGFYAFNDFYRNVLSAFSVTDSRWCWRVFDSSARVLTLPILY